MLCCSGSEVLWVVVKMMVPIFRGILNIRSRIVSETQNEIASLTACHTDLGDLFCRVDV